MLAININAMIANVNIIILLKVFFIMTSPLLRLIYDFPNNIDACLKKKDEIVSEITKLFSELSTVRSYTREHDQDITGESKFHSTDFIFHTGEVARVMCIEWSDKFKKDNYIDHLIFFHNLQA